MATLEFFYDCGSPWTYLAFHQVEGVAERTGAELRYRPVLVGGIFNQVNEEVYAARANPNPRRGRYHAKDLADWARLYELDISWPSVFPVNSVKAMRGALVAAEADRETAWSRACFEIYWAEGRDLSQDDVMEEVAKRAGLEPAATLARLGDPEIKDRLRANTQEVIDRGGFGSPTLFVNGDDMFFGNDRLVLVEAALGRV